MDLSSASLIALFEEAISRLNKAEYNNFILSATRFANIFGIASDPTIKLYRASMLESCVESSPIVRLGVSSTILNQQLVFKDEIKLESVLLRAEAVLEAYRLMLEVVEKLERQMHNNIMRLISIWVVRDIQLGESFVRAEGVEELNVLGNLLAKCLLCKVPVERVSGIVRDAFTFTALIQSMKLSSPLPKLERMMKIEEYRSRFKMEYLKLNSEVTPRLSWAEEEGGEEERKLYYELDRTWHVWVESDPYKLPAPFLIVPKSFWSHGVLPRSGEINLRPIRFPPFAVRGKVLLNAVYGVLGSGKTMLLNSLAVYRLDRNGFGLRIELDWARRLQTQLMATPLHSEHPAYRVLVDTFRLKPRPMDVVSLVIVRGDSDLKYANPPLKIDRIVYVENPLAFHLDTYWDELYKPGRLVCLKFLNMNLTAPAYISLLKSFLEYRASHRNIDMFIQVEEAMMGASAKISMMWSRSMMMSSEEIELLIQSLRGLGLTGDISSQRPSYIIVSARGQVNNIFCSHMAPQDLDAVFQGLPEKGTYELARQVLSDGSISFNENYKWFLWIDKVNDRIEFIRSVVPPCGCEIGDMDPTEIFQEYGLIAEGWSKVKRLNREPLPEHEPFLPEKEIAERRKGRRMRILDEYEFLKDDYNSEI